MPWTVAVTVAALAVYAATLCRTLYTSGAGENITAVVTLGVPHPPGFPLFCLAGKLFTLLVPVGSAALRVNLFSASCGAAAAAILYLVARRALDAPAAVAAAAALALAFSRTLWSQAVIAEVYTLNAVMLLAIALLLLRHARGAPLWPAGLAFGLGLAVHPIQALFLPGWVAMVLMARRTRPVTARDAGAAAGAVAVGASLHLYAPLRALSHPVLDWGDPRHLRTLIDYAMATQYRGRMFHLAASAVAANVRRATAQLAWEMTPLALPFAAIGAWHLARVARPLLAATAAGAAITFVYAVNYDIPWEIEVYFIPVAIAMALWVGAGLAWMARRWRPAAWAALLLPLAPLLSGWKDNDRSRHDLVLAYGHDILATCPRGSVLIAPQTDAAFVLLYLTAVEGQRPDVEIWIQRADGVSPLRDAVNPEVPPIREAALVRRLPPSTPVLHTDHIPADAVPGYREVPWGMLYRLLPRDTPAPPPPVPFERYQLAARADPPPGYFLDERSRVILARALLLRGDAAAAAGRREQALADYAKAERYGPDHHEILQELGARYADAGDSAKATTYLERSLAGFDDALVRNRLGRLYVKAGRLDDAQQAFEAALRKEPDLAIAHSNLGALRGMKGDVAGALAELRHATALDPGSTLAWNNLGRACALSGDKDGAARAWQRSLDLDPGQSDVRAQLAQLGRH